MAPPNISIPPTAPPLHSAHFDVWNSLSTGHQRAESRPSRSISWRQARSVKLSRQFRSGAAGGQGIADQAGAASNDWDERAKDLIPDKLITRTRVSVADMLTSKATGLRSLQPQRNRAELDARTQEISDNTDTKPSKLERGIFDGLVIYINGSTYPLISDHKLKHLLAENGARVSINLGRRQVTHVILGTPCVVNTGRNGAGGGLSASKIQKEIKRVGGCGVKYVGVEWVLESIKIGVRLPEAPFSNLKVAMKGQQSMSAMFPKSRSICNSENENLDD